MPHLVNRRLGDTLQMLQITACLKKSDRGVGRSAKRRMPRRARSAKSVSPQRGSRSRFAFDQKEPRRPIPDKKRDAAEVIEEFLRRAA